MDMYIRQKVFSIGDRYNVFDINQNLLYRVEGEILTFGAKLHLCDPSGGELLYIEQELFHMMPRYNLYCRGTLVASIRKNFTFSATACRWTADTAPSTSTAAYLVWNSPSPSTAGWWPPFPKNG